MGTKFILLPFSKCNFVAKVARMTLYKMILLSAFVPITWGWGHLLELLSFGPMQGHTQATLKDTIKMILI